MEEIRIVRRWFTRPKSCGLSWRLVPEGPGYLQSSLRDGIISLPNGIVTAPDDRMEKAPRIVMPLGLRIAGCPEILVVPSPKMNLSSRRLCLFVLAPILVALYPGWSSGDDWPQFRGPARDGVWAETGILQTFPAEGLKVSWRVPAGGGLASPIVREGRVFLCDSETKKPKAWERVRCYDEEIGAGSMGACGGSGLPGMGLRSEKSHGSRFHAHRRRWEKSMPLGERAVCFALMRARARWCGRKT